MELTERMQGSTRIVAIEGRIDQSTVGQFQERLTPWLGECKAGGAPMVLDFAGVEYISSVGLRALMLAARQVKAQQGRIAIAAPKPVVAEVFQVSRFNLVLTVMPDLAAALAAVA